MSFGSRRAVAFAAVAALAGSASDLGAAGELILGQTRADAQGTEQSAKRRFHGAEFCPNS